MMLPMNKIPMHDLGYLMHLYVHADELGQIEVDVLIVEREHLVDDVAEHAGLLAVEDVVHGHRHVEHLALQQSEHAGTFGRVTCTLRHDRNTSPFVFRHRIPLHHFNTVVDDGVGNLLFDVVVVGFHVRPFGVVAD